MPFDMLCTLVHGDLLLCLCQYLLNFFYFIGCTNKIAAVIRIDVTWAASPVTESFQSCHKFNSIQCLAYLNVDTSSCHADK